MQVDSVEIAKYLDLLAETPGWIERASLGQDDARLLFKAGKEDWSANEILAHLRVCADVWGGSLLKMITQEHPTLRYVSPRTWIRKKDYPLQKFRASLAAFTKQREALLSVLTALPIEGWSRGARFTGTTRGREETVFSYARRMALHENEHCEQIEALLRSS